MTKYQCIAILLFCSFRISATSLYISTTGNDTNDGSVNKPFASLIMADSMALPGDTVFIRGGIYYPAQQIHLYHGGTSGKFITFLAYPGELPVFDFSRCTIGPAVGTPPYPVDYGAITIDTTQYIHIEGIKVQNAACAGIESRGSIQVQIVRCQTFITVESGVSAWESDSVILDGNTIDSANYTTGAMEAISVSQTTNFVVSNNELKNCFKEGIDTKESDHHGKVINNYIHDLVRQGLYIDGWDEYLTDIEEYGNIVTRCMYGLAVSCELAGGIVDTVSFHHNVMYNLDRTGIDFTNWGSTYDDGMRANVHIYNNTVFDNGYRRVDAGGSPHGGLLIECHNIPNTVIENNIFAFNCSFCYATKDTTPLSSLVVQYNLLADYNNSHDNLLRYTDSLHNTISYFPYGFGVTYAMHGTNEVIGKAMFVDSIHGNFHLQSTSAAINQGNPAPAFNDSDGLRNSIGAFQYHFATNLSPDLMNPSGILIQVYPNPVSGGPFELLINGFDNLSTVNVKIYNASGQIVYQQKITGNHVLNMSGSQFGNGIYFVEANNNVLSGLGKFIVE